MTPPGKCELVGLCLERIELRPGAPSNNLETRRVALRMELHLRELIVAVEEQIVVELDRRPISAGSKDSTILDTHINLAAQKFDRGRRRSETPSRVEESTSGGTTGLHPLHRVLAWQRELSAQPDLNKTEVARRANVSAAILTHHFKLLQLAPDIQKVMLGLTSSRDMRRFSLNKMKSLAELSIDEQPHRLAEMNRWASGLASTAVYSGLGNVK
jgi:hypothetical protein